MFDSKHVINDPTFFVNFINIGRGLVKADNDGECVHFNRVYIEKTNRVDCWKICEKRLEKIPENEIGIFFDRESYVIRWEFDLRVDETITNEILVYHWKGQNSPKGFSPLPSNIEESFPVERLVQWSEPAIFFHIFAGKMIVLSGKRDEFDANASRLFIVRGEIKTEIHLYEIPRKFENLRRKTSFFLVKPEKNVMMYWHGIHAPLNYKNLINFELKIHDVFKHFEKSWNCHLIVELEEGTKNNDFLDTLHGNKTDYFDLVRSTNDFQPRLFYFNSITGEFNATEVEYPLRISDRTANFPFLQSHLYTAPQPGLFLVDNNVELWLWQGWDPEEGYDETIFENELKLAKKAVLNYAKQKGHNTDVKHVYAGLEPREFNNVFPFWINHSDIKEKQVQKGYSNYDLKK